MKRFISFILSLTLCITSINMGIFSVKTVAADTDEVRYQKMDLLIDQMMTDSDPTDGSPWNTESPSKFKWSYINGCMVSAMMDLYETTGEDKYLDFADTYMSPFISTINSSSSGYINSATSFKYTNYTLDDLNNGKALIELIGYGSSNSAKYQTALKNTLYNQILTYMLTNQTTAENNLWHKKAYPYQVWLDGIYMETPFYLQYELDIANDKTAFDTAANHVINQITMTYQKLRNPDTGLYYHGYNSQADINSGDYDLSSAISWANKGTGQSSNYWLRGTGWYAMALVDDIEILQQAQEKFGYDYSGHITTLTNIYKELVSSMLNYIDPQTHLWYQVIDNPDTTNKQYNYTETSGSAAMSYSLMKSYNLGITDVSYYNKGLEVFRGLCDNKLTYTDSSMSGVNLTDICGVAGLAGPSSGTSSSSAQRGPAHKARDGSYDYYVSENLVQNDAKGAAPLIFAYCEVIKYNNAQGNVSTTSTETTTQQTTEYTTEATTHQTTEHTTETTTAVNNVGKAVVISGQSSVHTLLPTSLPSGTASADITNDIFTVKATSAKTVNITDTAVDLSGGGNTDYRCVAFDLTGAAKVDIFYFNTGSTERYLAFTNSQGSVNETLTATSGGSASSIQTQSFDITETDKGSFYLYSKGSGIKISKITVTYDNTITALTGDINLNGIIDIADSALLLKHISGTSDLTGNSLKVADCNADGKYNLQDTIAILLYLQK